MCMVPEEGQTRLGFQHVDQGELSLYLIIPQIRRARQGGVFPNQTIMQEGVRAWANFQRQATRRDVLVEMINGLTREMWPETVWPRRRLWGLEP